MGVPEVKKDFEWCPHCKPGRGGCTIYEQRPERCRDFRCQWLIDPQFGDDWFPAHSKILVDHKVENNNAYVIFVVDYDYPTRWREEPWFSDIKKVARAGLRGPVRWTTVVLAGKERIIIGR